MCWCQFSDVCAWCLLSLDTLHLSCVVVILTYWDEIRVSICFSHAWHLCSSQLYVDWESLLPNALLLNSALSFLSFTHSLSFVLIWCFFCLTTLSSSWSCSLLYVLLLLLFPMFQIPSFYYFFLHFFIFHISSHPSGSWVIACFLLCYWWVLMLLHQLQSHNALLHCRIGLQWKLKDCYPSYRKSIRWMDEWMNEWKFGWFAKISSVRSCA